jgi:lipopolysaccharide export system permease protein
MPRLLFLYLMKRVAITAAVIQFALCVPVVLSYLLGSLSAAAVRGGLVWPALVGVAPTIAYVALPMAVGVATALEFSRMASEGMIAVLYALRLSVWAVCRPALILASVLVGAGYILSNFIAPQSAGNMQDVLNVVRNSLNHRMLDPARFYTFESGAKTLYLERWETPDIAVNLFLRQISADTGQEQTVTAARAEFRRNESGVIVALTKGSIQTRSIFSNDVRITNFDQYAMALPMQGSGGLPKRSWRGVFELPAPEFLAQYQAVRADRRLLAEWTTEAAMRVGVPLLTLGHALLAMALVLAFGNITGRRGTGGSLFVVAIPAAHILFLVALQSLLRADARFAFVLALLLLAEISYSVFLIGRLNYGPAQTRLLPAGGAPAPAGEGYAAPWA